MKQDRSQKNDDRKSAASSAAAASSAWKRLSPLLWLILGIGIGLLGSYIYLQHQLGENVADSYEVLAGGYSLINPIISCDISQNKKFAEFQPIESELQTYIKKSISAGNATDISVYFQGLSSGEWTGVNEDELYSPASLLKVPIMIAYLKLSETQPDLLSQKIIYRQTTDQNADETIKPAESIQDGQTYTIQDLIDYMIMYSDNNAAALLAANIDPQALAEVYSDLDLPISASSLTDATVSAKMYSYVFSVLYNAGYLHKTQSQAALKLLTEADFPQGIQSGIASGTPVAQKFGERSSLIFDPTTNQTTVDFRELHDCGIVYYPGNPYLLCVMTKGTDFTALTKVISDISGIIYGETDKGVLKN